MSRVNVFSMVQSISKESISTPNVDNVTLDAKKDIPSNAVNDPKPLEADDLSKADATNTKTTEPGPDNGGGDGTAQTVDVKTATTSMDVSDVNKNLTRDQNGGRDIDTLPSQVSAKDGLSKSDVSTSVEDHSEEGKEGGENAEASDLTTIDASGAEEIDKADNLIMDLDGEELEVTGMTDASESKLAELDSVAAKADSLSKATATVEKYHGLMVQMHKEGRYMSDELRQTISWALEDIDSQMFLPERVALESFNPKSRVSLEATGMSATTGGARSGTIDDGADPGEVSKGLGGKLKKMFEAGVKIFWRVVNMVNDLLTNLAQDTGKIKQHLVDLRKRVNVLEGGVKFTMKNPQRLMIGDEFVGDSSNAITKVSKVAQELLMNWPNALAKIIEDWKGARGIFGNHGGEALGAVIGGLDTALDRAFRSFDTLNPGDKAKVPSGFLSVDRLNWTGPLPGNMALYAGTIKPKTKGVVAQGMDQAVNGVTIDFSLIPGGETRSNDTAVTTLSAGEAVSVIRELEKLCGFIQDAKEGMRSLKTFTDGANQAAFMDLFLGMGGGEGQVAGIMVMGIAKTSTESQHRFLGYLINMIKAYIGFLEASLKAEASGDTIDA